MAAISFKETTLYKKVFAQAMGIFELSKSFPKEERYALTDQEKQQECLCEPGRSLSQKKIPRPFRFQVDGL